MSKEDVDISGDSLAVQPAVVSVETEPAVEPVNADAPVVDAPVVEANLKTDNDEDDSFFDKLNPFSKKK
jgi:hypothetical protein